MSRSTAKLLNKMEARSQLFYMDIFPQIVAACSQRAVSVP